MLAISPALQARFEAYLRNRRVPNKLHGEYKKWLRYYLDFCQKYQIPPTRNGNLPRFINKLEEKRQTNEQRNQAKRAISLYYEIVNSEDDVAKRPVPPYACRPAWLADVLLFSVSGLPFPLSFGSQENNKGD
jgi:hypothetical protein